MVIWLLTSMFAFFLDIFMILGVQDRDKDLEIILLRQQIRILQRKMKGTPRISAPDKMILAILAHKIHQSIKGANQRLHQALLIFKPDTILGWHRELVRRKWRFKRNGNLGRPRISVELEALVVGLAKENSRWGYEKSQGELFNLGYRLSVSTVRNIFKRHRVTPVSHRSSGSWRNLMKHYQDQILACDCFTVETIWLKTIYVLFFFELGTRRIHLAGCTSQPNQIWVSQQARQLVWDLNNPAPSKKTFLIHDHDSKFTTSFDHVFVSEGMEVIHTPYQAPRANAYAERWVRSVREECLDHLLVMNESHLRSVLKEYVAYYNHDRTHRESTSSFQYRGQE